MGYGQHPSGFSSAKAPGKVGQDHGQNRRLILSKLGPHFQDFRKQDTPFGRQAGRL